MTRIFKPIIVLLLVITSVGYADIFTNRSTGETFNGYALQKVINGKGRVYVETDDRSGRHRDQCNPADPVAKDRLHDQPQHQAHTEAVQDNGGCQPTTGPQFATR